MGTLRRAIPLSRSREMQAEFAIGCLGCNTLCGCSLGHLQLPVAHKFTCIPHLRDPACSAIQTLSKQNLPKNPATSSAAFPQSQALARRHVICFEYSSESVPANRSPPHHPAAEDPFARARHVASRISWCDRRGGCVGSSWNSNGQRAR